MALNILRKSGPRHLHNGTLKWEEHEHLIYFRGKLYILKNKVLRNNVIKSCHDVLTARHPKKHATLELVLHYYWWP